MGLTRKVEVEVEIKSWAGKFYDTFRGAQHMPNIISQGIQNVEMHLGEWGSHGSIKNWTYLVDGKEEKMKEKLVLDEANRSLTMVALEGDPMKLYKTYNVILNVTPNLKPGYACLVKWTLEYEKLNESAPDPHHYLDFATKLTTDLDAALLLSTPVTSVS